MRIRRATSASRSSYARAIRFSCSWRCAAAVARLNSSATARTNGNSGAKTWPDNVEGLSFQTQASGGDELAIARFCLPIGYMRSQQEKPTVALSSSIAIGLGSD